MQSIKTNHMKLGYLIIAFCVIVFLSCSHAKNDQLIIGKWNTVSWDRNGTLYTDEAEKYWFDFNDDGSYSSEFGGLAQKGTYRVDYNRLYTLADGEEEIVVEIKSITNDTLRLGMNRGGRPEILILAKE